MEYSAKDVSIKLFRSKLRIMEGCRRGMQSQVDFVNEVEETRFVDVPGNWGGLAKGMDDKCKALATLEDESKARENDRDESQEQYHLNSWALYKLAESRANDRDDARFACPLAARKFKKDTTDAVLQLLEEDCLLQGMRSKKLAGSLGIVDKRVCAQWPAWWKRQSDGRAYRDE